MPLTIPVTDSGLTNAQIVILTDQTFMNSTGVTVTATFSWTSSLQAQATYVTATDYMNVLPYPPIVVCRGELQRRGFQHNVERQRGRVRLQHHDVFQRRKLGRPGWLVASELPRDMAQRDAARDSTEHPGRT